MVGRPIEVGRPAFCSNPKKTEESRGRHPGYTIRGQVTVQRTLQLLEKYGKFPFLGPQRKQSKSWVPSRPVDCHED